MLIRYLSHPQVRADPDVAVPDWGLNDIGRQRVVRLAASGALAGTTAIVSSAERKAIDTAKPLVEALGIALQVRKDMHENDRSATGYLPPQEFEAVANAFFASPDISVRGWERAIDAQARIVGEVEAFLAGAPAGDVLVVGHGGVGTLLYCHFAGVSIDRRFDQKAGGGNVFVAERATRAVVRGWFPMEELL